MKNRSFLKYAVAILSPVLILFIVDLGVVFILFIYAGMYFMPPIVGNSVANMYFLAMNIDAFVDRYIFWAHFVSSIICLPIFLRMWKKTRKSIPSPTNQRSVLRIGTTLLVCSFTISRVFLQVSNYVILGSFDASPLYNAEVGVFDSSSLFMLILANVIVAPIIEELIFRGIMLNRLLATTSKWLAVLISGIIFGLMHLGSPLTMMYAIIGGIWYALFYVRFRSLLLCIIAHMVFNFIGLNVAIIVFIDSMATRSPMLSIVSPIVAMVGIGILLMLCPSATFEAESPADETSSI